MIESTFQDKCNLLTQAVLFRRLNQPHPLSQLYLCQVKERAKDDDYGWIVLSHDFPINRMVICGGNAGFSVSSKFEGNCRGVELPFRCESFISVEPIDLASIDYLKSVC